MRCFHGVDSDSNSLGGTILKSGGNKPPFLVKNQLFKAFRKLPFSYTYPLGILIVVNIVFYLDYSLTILNKIRFTFNRFV